MIDQTQTDTDTLIKQDEFGGCSESIGGYVFIHFAPVLAFFLLSIFGFGFSFSIIVIIFLGIVDFYSTKNYFGLGLVGLKWYYNSSEEPKFPHFVFFSQPLPFVATTPNSNAFWLGLFLSSSLWGFLIFVCFLLVNAKWALLASFMLCLSLINFWCFMQCHNLAKTKAENAARVLLLDPNVPFQQANELDNTDTTSSDIHESSENQDKIQEEEEDHEEKSSPKQDQP